MKTKSICLLTFAFSLSTGFVQCLRAEDILLTPPSDDTVRIYATGRMEKQADQAIVTMKVAATDAILREAISQIENRQLVITNSLAKLGVSKDRVSPARFANLPDHKLLNGSVRSYTVEGLIEVSIDSEKEFLAIARLIDASDGVDFVSRHVRVSDYADVATAASMKALEMLRQKQESYEKALGLKLELISFTEVPASQDGGSSTQRRSDSSTIDYVVSLEGRYRIAKTVAAAE